jgi:integrase
MKPLKFTLEALEQLQKKVPDEPRARIEVRDSSSKLRARITRRSITLLTLRGDHRVVLGTLSKDFSLTDAKRKLDESRVRPLEVVRSRRTFEQVAKAYYADRLSRTKRGADCWKHVFEVHLLPALGRYPVRDISPRLIRDFITKLATPVKDEETRRYRGGPGIARHCLRNIRAVLSRAFADRDVEFNAAATLSLKELGLSQKHKTRWLDEPLARLFFEALNLRRVLARRPLPEFSVSAQVRLGLAFLLYVPVRSGSLLGAKVTEFDLRKKVGQPATWRIPAMRIKGGTVDQALPLVGTALDIVKELNRLAEAADSEYLLFSPTDPKESIAAKTLTQCFRRMETKGRIGPKAEAGAERLTLHSLRASWRTWALELGVPAEVAERVMGHRSALAQLGFSSAAQLYTRSAALKLQAEALKKVGEHLDLFWQPGKGGKVVALRLAVEDARA